MIVGGVNNIGSSGTAGDIIGGRWDFSGLNWEGISLAWKRIWHGPHRTRGGQKALIATMLILTLRWMLQLSICGRERVSLKAQKVDKLM